ncbi:hypothetical protein F511_23064 [Dorcoceras hygrometricum]|uniref:Transcription repressor n=1 Tax=Dorcoceras hygrometricum TaxID=472368 RepID=A0A2Z7A808_9LAMI|nr:hypothetical protein F511_23064 [Dorcoceras hygrometricum]
MASSGKRWRRFKSILKPNGGWGCGPNATDVIEARHVTNSSSHQFHRHGPSSSASSWERHGGRRSIIGGEDEDHTSTTFSLNIDTSPQYSPHEIYSDHHPKCTKTVSSCRKIHDSLAVVKDSEDPLSDFRKSMLQMILEREIYSRSDLQQLLDCFLRLNSPQHREIIIQAFMEIWNNGGSGGCAGGTPPSSSDA